VAGELLHVPKRAPGFGYLLGGTRDEGPAATVAAGAIQAECPINPVKPDGDGSWSIAAASLRMNDVIDRGVVSGGLQYC